MLFSQPPILLTGLRAHRADFAAGAECGVALSGPGAQRDRPARPLLTATHLTPISQSEESVPARPLLNLESHSDN